MQPPSIPLVLPSLIFRKPQGGLLLKLTLHWQPNVVYPARGYNVVGQGQALERSRLHLDGS